MPKCAECGNSVAAGKLACSACGTVVATEAATVAFAHRSSPPHITTSLPDEGRFLPGTLLADRYRIAGVLGRGGMGEVYRATDLRLQQTVALKFLPESTMHDPATLARFYNEVRIARQVTHPNVCRVYDIGDVGGQPFLSMQFVDGENLASLLLRIGRLPTDKALEIARRLCAGLAAAHAQGVLHRDLKPANIMIDGRGQVIITDFGLAGLAEEIRSNDIRSGTPAYMAPEQLAGKEVTTRSDIYSLGLVLYEMFTGRRAFEADTLADLIRLREESRPAEISSVVHDLDPAVEKIILKCLDPEPAERPGSALAVSAALTGADHLAMALQAGETPSPEMVAASGSTEGMRPWVATLCLAIALIGIVATVVVNSWEMMASTVDFEMPPEALAFQARKLAAQCGYTTVPADRAWGFSYNNDYNEFISKQMGPQHLKWSVIANQQPAPILYWYRESPRQLRPEKIQSLGTVTPTDPPVEITGMVRITLDPIGRLVYFSAVPPQKDASVAPQQQPDATALFTAAGLDITQFKPATPEWNTLHSVDQRAAWIGVFPNRPDLPLRIETAWWRGKPVFFQMIGPWTRPTRMDAAQPGKLSGRIMNVLFTTTFLLGSLALAWRNLKLGRGDRKGAARIGGVAIALSIGAWALETHELFSDFGMSMMTIALGSACGAGAQLYLAYLALEPAVRRRWPIILISWTRLVSGRWKDALVGRDVLIGIIVGVGYTLILDGALGYYQHHGGIPETANSLSTLLGFRFVTSGILRHVLSSLTGALLFFMMFFILRLIVRKEWIAAIVFVLGMTVLKSAGNSNPIPIGISFFLVYGLLIALLLRCGLLAVVVAIFVTDLVITFEYTTNFSGWYATSSVVVPLLISALAIVAFRNALGGQKVLANWLEQ